MAKNQFEWVLVLRPRRVWLMWVFVGLSVFASAATLPQVGAALPPMEDGREMEDGQTTALPASLLWSITGNGLEDSSWLFGTIHLIGQSDFFVRPAVERNFNQCTQVAFEIKLDDMAMLMSMSQLLLLPDNQTLSDVLEPALYERLRTWMEDSLGSSMATYERQKPFAMLQAMIMQLLPENPASYELYFLMQARGQQKTIYGLETVADQLAVFDKIPATEQVLWTLDMLENKDSIALSFQAMVDAYKAEDLQRLTQIMLEESPEFEAYSAPLLDDRNARWIPGIEKLIHEKATFVAVGAGHLAGPRGVISLLRAQGYTVEPVMP